MVFNKEKERQGRVGNGKPKEHKEKYKDTERDE